MARYAIDIVIPDSDDSAETGEVSRKGGSYDHGNPLGISRHLQYFVAIYLPFLIVVASVLNIFGLWVLKSSFLRGLVLQPMIQVFLHLHFVLLASGPLYIWMGQTFGSFLKHSQIYPCFLLLWSHNFSMIATSCLLVAIMTERAISIGRPEVVWDIWRRACRNISHLLVFTSLVFSVSGLLCVDMESVVSGGSSYPICMPWWDNELGPDITWYKIVAIFFAALPCVAVLLALVLLIAREKRFKSAMRSGVSALNHFNAMFVEIKATLHFKFVRSFMWLGFLFLLTTTPIGLFILFGPNLQITFDQLYPVPLPRNSSSSAAQWVNNEDTNSSMETFTLSRPVGQRSYSTISRSDVETCLWMVYYSYSLLIVPVFLKTEVLFWREWSGRMKSVSDALCCRKRLSPKWRTLSGLNEEMSQGHLVGPYVPSKNIPEVPYGIQAELDQMRLTRIQESAPPATTTTVMTTRVQTVMESAPSVPVNRGTPVRGGGVADERSRSTPAMRKDRWNDPRIAIDIKGKQCGLKSEDTSSM